MGPFAKRSSRRWILVTLVLTVVVVMTTSSAWARPKEEEEPKGPPMYVLPVFVVGLGVALGMLAVCRPSKRLEKAKTDRWEAQEQEAAEVVFKPSGPPSISIGMRLDQVDGLLGKPTVARRGSEIFAEQHQAGALSDDEAAKIHAIYDHKEGRYEIVFQAKRVVHIQTQPGAE